MLAFASEWVGAARKLVGAERWAAFEKWPERGAERGAGCNRKGLSDGAANRLAPLRSHALFLTLPEVSSVITAYVVYFKLNYFKLSLHPISILDLDKSVATSFKG